MLSLAAVRQCRNGYAKPYFQHQIKIVYNRAILESPEDQNGRCTSQTHLLGVVMGKKTSLEDLITTREDIFSNSDHELDFAAWN
ncbi:hypothetical protein EVAR_7720_1 [Eumeta japonica]|uniref:Uncharacterized protein n=1 Tax=Eumeta variegata TaxID=151549 RepID=A0A4C1TIU3_EUMVA|nr:hypothetical protein EVAR_7720_1 [Eumeta japonica]